MPTRRTLLRSGAMFAAGAAVPGWMGRAWAGNRQKTLVAIVERGASDSLSVVVPHADSAYYRLRPTLAVAPDSAIDLDGFFGLHPALAPLKPLWDARQMAVIPAVAWPSKTRSHRDGLNFLHAHAAQLAADDRSPIAAAAFGVSAPRTLPVRETTANALRQIAAHRYQPEVEYPDTPLAGDLRRIAQAIKSGAGLEFALTEIAGWDCHVEQAGTMTTLLDGYARSLAAFCRDLGDRMEDVVIATTTEFGRTAAENHRQGTDHGDAGHMLVFGGGIRGGRVLGRWPGLEREQLVDGRGLAPTVDARAVWSELAARHLGRRSSTPIDPAPLLGLV
jgi:uncharacterized protein (DUF1501 family)